MTAAWRLDPTNKAAEVRKCSPNILKVSIQKPHEVTHNLLVLQAFCCWMEAQGCSEVDENSKTLNSAFTQTQFAQHSGLVSFKQDQCLM